MKRLFVIFCTIILTFGTIIPSYADSSISAGMDEKENLISEADKAAFLEEFGEDNPDPDSLALAEGILEELADVAINATNFPDSHLRNYVKENFDENLIILILIGSVKFDHMKMIYTRNYYLIVCLIIQLQW